MSIWVTTKSGESRPVLIENDSEEAVLARILTGSQEWVPMAVKDGKMWFPRSDLAKLEQRPD